VSDEVEWSRGKTGNVKTTLLKLVEIYHTTIGEKKYKDFHKEKPKIERH